MADRIVRFTAEFFDRLDELLPEQRGADGTASVTNFLLLDLPSVRDALVADFDRATLPTDDPDVRVLIGAGLLVDRFAVYLASTEEVVDVFWIALDRRDRGSPG